MIAVVFEARVAAHSVPRCHAVRLLSVERAAVRAVVARVLALIEEAMRDCVIHDAALVVAVSPDKGAALRHQLAMILMVLASVSTDYLSICDHLLRPTYIDIVRHHVLRDSRPKFLFGPLARLAERALDGVVRGSVVIATQLLVVVLLSDCCAAACRAVRRLVVVVSLLKGSIQEACIRLELGLRCVHH